MHVHVSGVAGQGFEDLDELIHVGKLPDEAKIDEEVSFVVAGAHAFNVADVTGKPPTRFELFNRLDILKSLNPVREITLTLMLHCLLTPRRCAILPRPSRP